MRASGDRGVGEQDIRVLGCVGFRFTIFGPG
jgi:hypothetical protein